jgi:DNA polymerase eta
VPTLVSFSLIAFESTKSEFERVRRGLPDNTPLITIQWETVLAVNYPARAFGITRCVRVVTARFERFVLMDRNTPIADARTLCPDLVVAHVATYREGDSAPQYRDDPSVLTDKVRIMPQVTHNYS